MPLGTAAWYQFEDGARPTFSIGDFWLSRLPTGERVGFRDDRHVLVAAGTRTGKGTSVIVPNLCFWPGSVVVIDPKGENAMITARRRGWGSKYCHGWRQKVRILDPFDAVGSLGNDFSEMKVAFNPLDAINEGNGEAIDMAARIAESIIVDEASGDPYWPDAARELLKSFMLHVASWKDYLPQERNLITVRRLLMAGDAETRKLIKLNGKNKKVPSGLALLFDAMCRNKVFNGVVANAGEHFSNLERTAPRVLASILQVACTNSNFIDSPGMARCLAKSDFSIEELKTEPRGISLYLCLPQRFMETHFRWLRMMTTLIVTEMERVRTPPASGHPVLMVLDEFAGLRRMRVLENAAAQIAGFGIKMVFVVQTLAQLKDIYRDNWETLVANAGVKLFFGNDDNFTRDYVSKLVGECEVGRAGQSSNVTHGTSFSYGTSRTAGLSNNHSHGYSSNTSFGGNNASHSSGNSANNSHGFSSSIGSSETYGTNRSQSDGFSESVQKRPLVTPDEVGRLFGDRDRPATLALIAGLQPLYLKRTHYFQDQAFVTCFDRHPDHKLPLTLEQAAQKKLEAKQRKEEEDLRQRAAEEAIREKEIKDRLLQDQRKWQTDVAPLLREIERSCDRVRVRRRRRETLRSALLLGIPILTTCFALTRFFL
jgi:type IV secretory pathway TraG/TraD family ATPase VirD4